MNNQFCYIDSPNLKVPLRLFDGHVHLSWTKSAVLFTRRELLNLHQIFANPFTDKLMELLKRASSARIDGKTRKNLKDMAAQCTYCQRMVETVCVPSYTPDNIVFNLELYLDLVWIDPRTHKLVLHVVDRGTHFSTVQFVANDSDESVCNIVFFCFVLLHVCLPYVIDQYQGSVFTDDFFTNT